MMSNIRIGDGTDHPYTVAELFGQHRLEMNHIGRAIVIYLVVHTVISGRRDHAIEFEQFPDGRVDPRHEIEHFRFTGNFSDR